MTSVDADTGTNTSFLRKWAPLTAVSTGFLVVVLDSTMMNVAVPAIAKDLGTTVSGVQAAIALYSMVMASLVHRQWKEAEVPCRDSRQRRLL